MKLSRPLSIVTAIVVALPAVSFAQQGRDFKNAWFWGIKGGGLTLADSGQMMRQAPMGGIDWLITRTHGGLYISGSQSFFKQQTFTLRDPSAPDSGARVINLQDMRRLDVALMGFPGEHLRFHPYVGAGFTLSQIATAVPQGPFGNEDQLNYADAVIQDQKVGFSPLFILGLQARLKSAVSIFLQGTATPTQRNFLLYNGRSMNFSYEAGLRYNVGSSISRD